MTAGFADIPVRDVDTDGDPKRADRKGTRVLGGEDLDGAGGTPKNRRNQDEQMAEEMRFGSQDIGPCQPPSLDGAGVACRAMNGVREDAAFAQG